LDDPLELGPEPSGVVLGQSFPGIRYGLARKASREKIKGWHSGSCDVSDIPEVGDSGPVSLEDSGAIGIRLCMKNCLSKARPFQSKLQTPYAAEDASDPHTGSIQHVYSRMSSSQSGVGRSR
jgi:hypothetical protein